ncbi:MAG: hypothetical protein PHS83_04200 [Clostridia bacterium]|nr:hypothetical protein [Clostridia bacterium]MDD4665856.1 hypothetical protein [Clostridia bacterium]
MEKIFALVLVLLLFASAIYLLIGFVIIPIVKLYQENIRLKR